MPPQSRLLAAVVVALAALPSSSAAEEPSSSKRGVLVELYTSQGCDMCPAAEEILGRLAAENPGIVPIAFHVDYFNKPWKDVFSDPIYSQRQMVYNDVYTGPKPESYGLYYTPMLMIDGARSVNGRDPASAAAAIRAARTKPPAVSLDVKLDVAEDGLSGKAFVAVARRSTKLDDAPLLVCAVLREDGVSTDVQSGENAGKTLIARFPARRTEYDFVELNGTAPASKQFAFTIDPAWKRDRLRLACFVQNKRTAVVYQAVDIPWRATKAK
ncbi:DUF1223 domain-containing protein [Paludisphaera rhizosphaerae]|uniref:DUF1223 domain-containing protein n=1 Tax=Paludisphaera rhizosphaerae TaxID=2711216 RepID=UPI0013EA4A7D|nr:DUF1223 domain-containing protein [Paludisphaera rhizosphaerae]